MNIKTAIFCGLCVALFCQTYNLECMRDGGTSIADTFAELEKSDSKSNDTLYKEVLSDCDLLDGIERNNFLATEAAIKQGANPEMNIDGQPLAEWAKSRNTNELVVALLAKNSRKKVFARRASFGRHNSDPDMSRPPDITIPITTGEPNADLRSAIENQDFEGARLALGMGASPVLRSEGSTPICAAFETLGPKHKITQLLFGSTEEASDLNDLKPLQTPLQPNNRLLTVKVRPPTARRPKGGRNQSHINLPNPFSNNKLDYHQILFALLFYFQFQH